jgi:hypothetical protein
VPGLSRSFWRLKMRTGLIRAPSTFCADRRIESFLGDVLALAGEAPDAIHEGVRVAFAECEEIFRAQEPRQRTWCGTPQFNAPAGR